MERISIRPRINLASRLESIGFNFHTIEGKPYWDESACYHFSTEEVDMLDDVTQELHGMCLKAVEHVIEHALFDRLRIPALLVPLIKDSWKRQEPSVYGRFDLAYDGISPPKMLEYNADTPTALFEASVVQWHWLEDVFPGKDQFNSIHEDLFHRWQEIAGKLAPGKVLFACVADNPEDETTTAYMRDVAIQTGLDTDSIFMEEIGCDAANHSFVDRENKRIASLFKLYPYEWMAADEFGQYLQAARCRLIEPPWKVLLSSKAILPILWELYPRHPNLLPAYFSPEPLRGRDFVKKPCLSREGANITVQKGGRCHSTEGRYGAEGFIYQEQVELRAFDGRYPILGSWVIGDQAAGLGIREDETPITQNSSCFVPHYFD